LQLSTSLWRNENELVLMNLFKRERTLYLKHDTEQTQEELLEKLYERFSREYRSCKLRGNYIEFDVSSILKPNFGGGPTGSIELFDEKSHIRTEVRLADHMSAASSVLVLVITAIVGFVAYFNSNDEEAWVYPIAFPIVGLLVGILQSVLFHVFSYFRFKTMLERIRFFREEEKLV